MLLPKDYVRLRLTGDHAMDKADGAGTILFDLAARDWSAEVLAALEIDPAWLPPTCEGPEITGRISRRGRRRDRPRGPARRSSPVAATRRRTRSGSGRSGPARWRCRWGPRASSSRRPTGRSTSRAAGPRLLSRRPGSLAPDVGDALGGRQPALVPGCGRARASRSAISSAPAAEVPAGSDGLLFLPYLSGERSPHPDPLARGAFVGLTLGHDRRHLTRAVLEGVAFGLRDGLDLMIGGRDAGRRPRSGRPAAGPRARSGARSWPTSSDAEIATVSTTEGAAYGAGLLAAVGAGWFPTVEAAADALVTVTPVAAPGPDAPAYAQAHAIYRDLYPALAPTFPRTLSAGRSAPQLELGQLLLGDVARLLAEDDHPEDVVGGHVGLVDRVDDLAVVHDADPIRQVEDVVDVVADQEDPDPLVLELADEVRGPGPSRPARARRSARP